MLLGCVSPLLPSLNTSLPLPQPPFRILKFGHMSITVEKQTVHEIKGDTVAPGAEGLLNLQPSDFVFYVGGYPKSFTVSLDWPQTQVPILGCIL